MLRILILLSLWTVSIAAPAWAATDAVLADDLAAAVERTLDESGHDLVWQVGTPVPGLNAGRQMAT